MASDAAAVGPDLSRDEAGKLLGQTMAFVAATTGAFALGAYLGRNISSPWSLLFFLASLGCLFALSSAVRRTEQAAMPLLFGFGLLTGLAVAPTLAYYASVDPRAVWMAGGAAALFVAGFGAAGYTTRRDLSGLARVLFWALVALIGFGIVAIFVRIPNGDLIYAIVGLGIFGGLIAFDFQRLRRSTDIKTAPLLAASIFLDIINVFLLLLSLFGGGDE